MDRPGTVLVTGARAPAAVHMGRLLSDAGIHVVYADSCRSQIAIASRSCRAFELLPAPVLDLNAYETALRHVIDRHSIDHVIPTCEEIFHLAQVKLSVPLWAPPLDMLARAHNKYTFVEWAREIGLPVPKTSIVTTRADLDACMKEADRLVFKPAWSRFASSVRIRPTSRQLSDISPTPSMPWVAQEFLHGREVSVFAFARTGQLAGLSAYTSLFRAGRGAGICFEPVRSPALTTWVETFVRNTHWNGQISFDMIETAPEHFVAIECNPRTTSGIHAFKGASDFSDAAFRTGIAKPAHTGLLSSRMAMWWFGLPQALRDDRWQSWRSAMRTSQDILDWPSDPGPRSAQLATVLQFAKVAVAKGISLQRASTYDIEWNGPDHSSIS